MSATKDKVRLGDQAVEDAEHFAHDGHEAHGGRFAGGAQSGVEGAKDRIAARGSDGGHVEDVSDLRAAGSHMARSTPLTSERGASAFVSRKAQARSRAMRTRRRAVRAASAAPAAHR